MDAVVHAEHLERDHWWFRARRDIFASLLEPHVPVGGSARILDLGPGSGVNLPVLKPRGAVTVLDVSLESLRACRTEGAQQVVQADACQPPLRDACFDLVTALDVLEHLVDDERALRAVRRLLAPEGLLLVSVPAFPFLWGRQDVLAQHQRRYARGVLEERLERAGFAIELSSYFNTWLFPPIAAVRLVLRPFLPWTRKGGSDLAVRAPFGLDEVLYRIFASERRWLGRRRAPIGVSLVCLARPKP